MLDDSEATSKRQRFSALKRFPSLDPDITCLTFDVSIMRYVRRECTLYCNSFNRSMPIGPRVATRQRHDFEGRSPRAMRMTGYLYHMRHGFSRSSHEHGKWTRRHHRKTCVCASCRLRVVS